MKLYAPNPTVFMIVFVLLLIGTLNYSGIFTFAGLQNIAEELPILGFLLLLLGTSMESFQKLYDSPLGKK